MKIEKIDRAIGRENEVRPVVAGLASMRPPNAPPPSAPATIFRRRTFSVCLSPATRPCSRPAMYSSEGNDGALSDKRTSPHPSVLDNYRETYSALRTFRCNPIPVPYDVRVSSHTKCLLRDATGGPPCSRDLDPLAVLPFDVHGHRREDAMAFHRGVQFWRRRLQPRQHGRHVVNIRRNRHGVAPVLRDVIDDIGTSHRGSNDVSSLIFETEPVVDVDNIVNNDHPWHRDLPSALFDVGRQKPPSYHSSWTTDAVATHQMATVIRKQRQTSDAVSRHPNWHLREMRLEVVHLERFG